MDESRLVEAGCDYEEVDGPECVHASLDNGLGILDSIGSTVDGLCHPTGLRDPSGEVSEGFGTAGSEGELRAHCPEGLGDASPQCSRGARDDCALPLDGETIEGVWSWLGWRLRGHSAPIPTSKNWCTAQWDKTRHTPERSSIRASDKETGHITLDVIDEWPYGSTVSHQAGFNIPHHETNAPRATVSGEEGLKMQKPIGPLPHYLL